MLPKRANASILERMVGLESLWCLNHSQVSNETVLSCSAFQTCLKLVSQTKIKQPKQTSGVLVSMMLVMPEMSPFGHIKTSSDIRNNPK